MAPFLKNALADFEFAAAATSLKNGEVTWGLLNFLVANLHGRSEGASSLIDIFASTNSIMRRFELLSIGSIVQPMNHTVFKNEPTLQYS